MVTDPWKMFRGADFGDNIEEVVETEECKVLRLNEPSGDGLMTIYRVFDGVYLIAGKGAWNTERNRISTII